MEKNDTAGNSVICKLKGKLQVNQRLNLVIEDNWSKFNLEQFAKRVRSTLNNGDDDESIFKKWNANINKNMEAGEFRKAMSIVDSFGIPQVVPSIDVFEKLQSKHPTKNQAEVLNEDEWDNIFKNVSI